MNVGKKKTLTLFSLGSHDARPREHTWLIVMHCEAGFKVQHCHSLLLISQILAHHSLQSLWEFNRRYSPFHGHQQNSNGFAESAVSIFSKPSSPLHFEPQYSQ